MGRYVLERHVKVGETLSTQGDPEWESTEGEKGL